MSIWERVVWSGTNWVNEIDVADPPVDPAGPNPVWTVGVSIPGPTVGGTGYDRDSFGNIIRVAKPTETFYGDYTMNTSNGSLKNLIIVGRLIIGNGVANPKIRNVEVRAPGTGTYGDEYTAVETQRGTGVLIEFCEVYSVSPGWAASNGVGHKNYTIRWSHIHHVTDALRVHTSGDNSGPANVLMEGVWTRDHLVVSPDPSGISRTDNMTHSDGIEIEGGSNIVVRGCRFDSYISKDYGSNVTWGSTTSPYAAMSYGASGGKALTQANSCIIVVSNTGVTSGLVIEDNWFNGGKIALNFGNAGNAGNDAIIRRNKFNHDQWFVGHAIDIDATGTNIVVGSGADANVYADTGALVTVRRNA